MSLMFLDTRRVCGGLETEIDDWRIQEAGPPAWTNQTTRQALGQEVAGLLDTRQTSRAESLFQHNARVTGHIFVRHLTPVFFFFNVYLINNL
ncbi:hypothetical protein EUGRSUZ_L00704 [Eucalyptus grandis]|uniref:Uncharacterized protein n=1 Tax=Eucalyptus grandis TaxID=71139 RepID=A0A058ZX07_EUCGR|nr:hypothetical protein EUGRSUZ_L00704 [Eucalyptus grandis]